MAENGRLPSGQLGSIAGGGRLRRDAAGAWNTMADFAAVRWGRGIHANDSYRPLGAPGDLSGGRWSQWAAWERFTNGGNLAARPGTSNHGWGLAVDVDQWTRWAIDQAGRTFGWAKDWSDAASEWWHLKWREGIWPPTRGNVRLGDRGPRVIWVQERLKTKGYGTRVDGAFGPATQRAVNAFKTHNGLRPDGFVGDTCWKALAK
jgi:hypothetical protein